MQDRLICFSVLLLGFSPKVAFNPSARGLHFRSLPPEVLDTWRTPMPRAEDDALPLHSEAPLSKKRGSRLFAERRRLVLAAASGMCSLLLRPLPGLAFEDRPNSAEFSASDILRILAAQSTVQALLKDKNTVRSMVNAGFSSEALNLPPQIEYDLFLKIENSTSSPRKFRGATYAYIEYAAYAKKDIEKAQLIKKDGGKTRQVEEYVDDALDHVENCRRALAILIPLLPPMK
mmetsp:Transcript_19573/g.35535  ORF Transcript_19573/g.35535 Transcript_19573/m.35535 type:complete len:232 (-) Transcript_19573:187-882(-)